jgi:hypothetical protein
MAKGITMLAYLWADGWTQDHPAFLRFWRCTTLCFAGGLGGSHTAPRGAVVPARLPTRWLQNPIKTNPAQ